MRPASRFGRAEKVDHTFLVRDFPSQCILMATLTSSTGVEPAVAITKTQKQRFVVFAFEMGVSYCVLTTHILRDSGALVAHALKSGGARFCD
jgi:hypothetical protein